MKGKENKMTVKINLATGEVIMDEEQMEIENAKALAEFQKKTGFSNFLDELDVEILDGDFIEGETVKVRIDGKEYTRKVRNSSKRFCDLYIMVKGYAFTLSDFNRQEW